MTNILLLIAIGLLVTLIILAIVGLNKLGNMTETWERTRDKLASLSSGIDKLDTAVDWWLGREGLKLEYTNINWRWIVTSSSSDDKSIYRTLEEMDRDKREALARALYEANLQAMRDFNKEQEKEKRRKKK
jgi:biopolymer transport protein ExbB/TolQ